MDQVFKNFYLNLPIKEAGENNFIGDVVNNDIYSNKFYIDLYDGKRKINTVPALYATITIRKPDHTEIIDNCKFENAKHGQLSYVLPQGAVSMEGVHFATIELYSQGNRMTSAQLTYNVKEELSHQEGITSVDEYPILTQLIIDTQSFYDEVHGGEQVRIENEEYRKLNEKARKMDEESRRGTIRTLEDFYNSLESINRVPYFINGGDFSDEFPQEGKNLDGGDF